jgi:soluble lytic murein transglycosylase-like protein
MSYYTLNLVNRFGLFARSNATFAIQSDFAKMTPKNEVFWGPRPQNQKLVNGTPKRHILTPKHVVRAINRENRSTGLGCALFPEKKAEKRRKKPILWRFRDPIF